MFRSAFNVVQIFDDFACELDDGDDASGDAEGIHYIAGLAVRKLSYIIGLAASLKRSQIQ